MSSVASIINVLAAFWTTWGPWIGASLVPTIIAGLTISPKLAPEAGLVQKIWDRIKQVMSFLSFATHKDTVGTFKLPLGLHKIGKKNVPPAAGAAMILLAVLSVNQGCSWFKTKVKAEATVILHCTEQAIKDKAQGLIPAIIAIASDPATLGAVVGAFASSFGEEIVGCAVDGASTQQAAKVATGGAVKNDPELAKLNALRDVMSKRHWVVEGKH
jgi:hypothetical protein